MVYFQRCSRTTEKWDFPSTPDLRAHYATFHATASVSLHPRTGITFAVSSEQTSTAPNPSQGELSRVGLFESSPGSPVRHPPPTPPASGRGVYYFLCFKIDLNRRWI